MGGECSALLQLYLSSVLIIGALLAVNPIPSNSTDWCAKDIATRYAVVPIEPPLPQLEAFPNFNCAPMTKEECDKMGLLAIPECIGKSVVDLNLKNPKRGENAREFRNLSLGIPTIRADRAVSFGIWNGHLLIPSVAVGIDYNTLTEDNFLGQALAPIRKNVIEFTIYDCSARCPSKLPALQLTSLLSFSIQECDYSYRRPVVFRRADFLHNARLRVVIVDACFSIEIERFTFTNLPELRLVALEKQFFQGRWTSDRKDELVPQLKKLHCECDYAWLRDWYRVNRGLVSAKPAGDIYQVCGTVSPAFKSEDIFVPVNCSGAITSSQWDYDWKKGFFGDAQRLAATYQLFICVTAVLVGFLLF